MIVVVDDDEAIRFFVQEALQAGGYEVKVFNDAAEALEFMQDREPELVLSDVVMWPLAGFQLKELYAERFPKRTTPFLFLSSLSDPQNVVKGLELGADDFLQKPIAPEVLRAKVRAHLRRAQRATLPAFHGDLAKFPFIKVLQFCEVKGLSGEVEVSAEGVASRIRFEAGQIANEGGHEDEALEKLLDLKEGLFTIHSRPVDFGELAGVAAPSAPLNGSMQVMGRLSGVRVHDRLFQIQTEYAAQPEPAVVTIVLLDGKTRLKRVTPSPGRMREELQQLVNQQHLAVESDVEAKLQRLAEKTPGSQTPKASFASLFEDGLSRYLLGDFAGALDAWEAAHALDPSHKILNVNLKIVRRKLAG